jgi:hypothetical protein
MRNLWVRLASWLGRRAQAAPLDPGNPFAGLSEEQIKATLAAALRGSFDAGVSAERARVSEVLQAHGAALFPSIAIDLALGTATGAQAAAVLSRAETDAAKRAGLLKPVPLESAPSAPTVH